jgi:mitochondrial import receptor subunit TOM40
MVQLEHDYLGTDYSVNIKALNPSPLDGSGMYIGSYFQSVSKKLAVGVESVYQTGPSPIPGLPPIAEVSTSYLAKYTGKDWVATTQVQPVGAVQATYWQKLGEKLEVAAELQLVTARQRREAVATVGAKYSLRQAMFRAQVDSAGKVSALLEQQLAPTFSFLLAGEIDHVKVSWSEISSILRL